MTKSTLYSNYSLYLAHLGSSLLLHAYTTNFVHFFHYNIYYTLVLVTTELDIVVKYLFLFTNRFYLIRLRDNIIIIISFQFNLILMMDSMTNIDIELELQFTRLVGDFSKFIMSHSFYSLYSI